VPYWSRSFDGLPERVSEVREFIRDAVGDDEGVDLVEMVASELVGNAIRHSESGEPGGVFTVRLATFVNGWHVRVDDAGGTSEPHICEAPAIESVEDLDRYGDEIEAGRGLAMVAAISAKWGVLGDSHARAVWAEIVMPRAVLHDGCESVQS
jgi:serine/threonine-protein kinase RsbW